MRTVEAEIVFYVSEGEHGSEYFRRNAERTWDEVVSMEEKKPIDKNRILDLLAPRKKYADEFDESIRINFEDYLKKGNSKKWVQIILNFLSLVKSRYVRWTEFGDDGLMRLRVRSVYAEADGSSDSDEEKFVLSLTYAVLYRLRLEYAQSRFCCIENCIFRSRMCLKEASSAN